MALFNLHMFRSVYITCNVLSNFVPPCTLWPAAWAVTFGTWTLYACIVRARLACLFKFSAPGQIQTSNGELAMPLSVYSVSLEKWFLVAFLSQCFYWDTISCVDVGHRPSFRLLICRVLTGTIESWEITYVLGLDYTSEDSVVHWGDLVKVD